MSVRLWDPGSPLPTTHTTPSCGAWWRPRSQVSAAGDKQEIMNQLTTMVRRLEKRIAQKLAEVGENAGDGGGAPWMTKGGAVQGKSLNVGNNSSSAPKAAKGPRQGPGGPSLGGGFMVALPGKSQLPKI